ncbi:hypothetical protein FHR81_002169 [Actinoalloteichus hoggarensis]|uniref:hypothetical protein n=1 Tax=Actinoalloteichus hoggarensis TaxID=1470176 RepID=UPI00146FAC93|nr:hypothetical protein [Actinoalloteichus hoggarensis]MBB5921131.1 hypothetical protein [Actinoalloteichus hoggarensis]
MPLAVETGAAGRPETLLCWISTVIQLGGGSAVLLRPRAAAATGLAAAVGVLLLLWTGGLGVTAGYFGGINPWPPSRSSSPSD